MMQLLYLHYAQVARRSAGWGLFLPLCLEESSAGEADENPDRE